MVRCLPLPLPQAARGLCIGALLVAMSSFVSAQARRTSHILLPNGEVVSVGSGEEEDPDTVRQREMWFYGQRAYPYGSIPAGARLNAELAMQRMIAAEHAGPRPNVLASSTQWTLIGPQPTGSGTTATSGRVAALAVDPRNRDVVYLGGAQGGVWKTTDGGITWVPLTDTQASLAIGSIALDPSNPDIVYVGTGEANYSGDSYYGAGILKSTDAGTTWKLIQGPFAGPASGSGYSAGGAHIAVIAVHPTNGQILLAGVQSNTTSGIYRSIDGGNTWTSVLTGGFGSGALFDPNNPNIAYAAIWPTNSTSTAGGVYKSTDAGATWTLLDAGGSAIPRKGLGRIELALAHSSPNILFASLGGNSALIGLVKSTDGGQSWTKLNAPDYCQYQCWYDHFVIVHPTNPNIVVAGGSGNWGPGLVRSMDGGATWTDIETGANKVTLHVDHHAAAFASSGSLFYEGNDGGVWSTPDTANADVNWTNLNATLSITQFNPSISIYPSNPDIALGGTQDNGTQLYTGAIGWQPSQGGDGGWTAIDAGAPSTVYGGYYGISPHRNDNLGAVGGWYDISPVLSDNEYSAFYPPLVSDPAVSGTLYVGTQRVWQTRDGGTSWAPISSNLTNNYVVTAIVPAPSNSNVVYAGTGDSKVWISRNALSGTSSTWTDISSGIPSRFISQMVVSPTNEFTAYVVLSGFDSGTNAGHIFKTTSAGASWTNISGNLPNIPVNDLVVDPDLPNTLYAATDVGVLITTDGGNTWAPLMTGLPHVAVMSLRLHRKSRILRAATHGRSIWDLKLANFAPDFGPTSVTPPTATVGRGAFTLTVNGNGFTQQSSVTWNGASRATSFISGNQLQAAILDSDLQSASIVPVAVTDPSRSSASPAVQFPVLNPAPVFTRLSTYGIDAGSGAFTLTVTGSNFIASTVVLWNGSPRPTTLISSTQLSGAISASDIAEPGYAMVSVSTPPPGGGRAPSGLALLSIRGATPPPNDNFANATPIVTAAYTVTTNNAAATKEPIDPVPCNGGGYGSLWWRFTPNSNGTAVLDTIGTYFLPAWTYVTLGVYTGAPGAFAQAACGYSFSGTARVSFAAVAGTTYYVMLSSMYSFGVGHVVLNATIPVNGNPPVLTSLSPAGGTAGSPAFTLTVNGSAFQQGAAVRWNGSQRATTYGNANQLTASILARDMATSGSASVTVVNPDGGVSAAVSFPISNAVPALSAVSPGIVAAGTPGTTMIVTGLNFANGARIRWNGSDRQTTYVSSRELSAALTAADVAGAGSASVTVANPAPGGGVSTALPVTIAASLPLPAQLPAKPALRYIPHFLIGGGFVTKLTITNLTNSLNNLVVNMISTDGTLLSSVNWNLAPAATMRIQGSESLRAAPGTAQWVIVGGDANLTVNAFFEVADQNGVTNTAGYSDVPAGMDFTFPAEFEPSVGTALARTFGVAVANPSATASNVTVTLVDAVGTVVASDTVKLDPFAQTSFDLSLRAPFQTGLPGTDFFGAVTLQATTPVVAIGVGDDRGPYYAVPAVAGRAK